MRVYVILIMCLAAAVIAYWVGTKLSSDALGMAVGVIFGVLAGIPAALLVLATSRRQQGMDDEEREEGDEVRKDEEVGSPAAPEPVASAGPAIFLRAQPQLVPGCLCRLCRHPPLRSRSSSLPDQLFRIAVPSLSSRIAVGIPVTP